MTTLSESDVELRAISVWPAVCHSKYASLCVSQIEIELISKGCILGELFFIKVGFATFAGTVWVTTLYHESRNESMELDLVIEL